MDASLTLAFRENPHLQRFILTGVTSTGKTLGKGAYGSVLEVKYQHLTYVAKGLHESLLEGGEGVEDILHMYKQECQLMASLRHPHITQFLGLCFLPQTRLPLLVMERLEMSLDNLLQCIPDLLLALKLSFLQGVCRGLVYLHNKKPPIVHRVLTATNVLLTSSLVSKITDIGNSRRLINTESGQLPKMTSQTPGTLVYMPPEFMSGTNHSGPALDIFSFGHLALYTLTQVFPGNLLSDTYPDPHKPDHTLTRSEVERRKMYIEKLEAAVGWSYPPLAQLVRQCLHNTPEQRPTSVKLLGRVEMVRLEVEGGCGRGVVNQLDVGKVLLLREMKSREKGVEEVETLLVRMETENRELRKQFDILEEEVAMRDRQLWSLQHEKSEQDRELQHINARLDAKSKQLDYKDEDIQLLIQTKHSLEETLLNLHSESSARESAMQEKLHRKFAEVRKLTEDLQRCQELLGSERVEQAPDSLHLKWRCGTDVPFDLSGRVQSVVMQGIVYVGGGHANYIDYECVVIAYDIQTGKWYTLIQHTHRRFAMVAMSNQLVLVGGCNHGYEDTNILGVWDIGSRQWSNPYPPMPTARSDPSAVGHKQWLIVAGGMSHGYCVSTVEMLDVGSKQWCRTLSTPTPWTGMKSTLVGDMWYFMGGYVENGGNSDKVYSVSLQSLLSQDNLSSNGPHHAWKMISGLGLKISSPLCIGRYLLAVGGMGVKGSNSVASIQRYLPETEEWVHAGELPSALYNCTCAMTSDGEVLVAGGYCNTAVQLLVSISRMVYIGSLI